MSKGQVQVLRQILGAGGDASKLPLAKVRRNFALLLSRFPGLESVDEEPVDPSKLPELHGEAHARWVDARENRSRPAERAILYLHGGGFVLGSIDSHRHLMARLSRQADARCLALNYRLAPEHPYPAALDDALAAFRALPGLGFAAEHTAIAGDSAGGGLALITAARLREAGDSLPASLYLISP